VWLFYKSPDGRKSGDPYTSSYNSFHNGCIHAFIFVTHNQLISKDTVKQSFKKLKMVVQGDDNALRHLPISIKIDWKTCMLKMGFKADAIKRDNLLDMEFCSNKVYYTDQGLCFGPKPGKVLSKIGYFVNLPNICRNQLMRGVALGLKPSCNFIPPINAYLDRILELTEGSDSVKQRNDEWKLTGTYANYVPETYLTLINNYSWCPNDQALWEKQLSTWQFGEKIDNDKLDYMMNCDTSGPKIY